MAQPIPLEVPPRNPRAELRSRLEVAPEDHAEAILAAYEVLQELHNRGVLEIIRGGLAASDEILETVVGDVKTPEAIARATAERNEPVKFFSLLRRLTSKDSLRGLAAALDFLQAFGRHLQTI